MPHRWSQFVEACQAGGLLAPGERERMEALGQNVAADALERLIGELDHGRPTAYQVAELLAGRGARLVRGDYTILEPLGSGGMGRVFKAVHRRMDRVVAIKELPTEAVNSPAARDRFHQEVKAAARLIHPHIVTAFDAGEQGGVPYLVMEHVDGQDLATVLKENGELPLAEALNCVLQVARGLDYAHGRGIIHRDIKPGNLLLDWAGNIRILDMGLARLDGHGAGKRPAARVAAESEVVGTFDYMAPEQAAGFPNVDARADIYSLGCTLYRIVTGRCLYAGATPEEKRRAHRESPVPRIADIYAETPAAVEQLFQRMVAKDPRERPATMGQVILALEECLAQVRQAAPVLAGVGAVSDSEAFTAPLSAEAMPALQPAPPDTAHESTVVTKAVEELTHPAVPPTIAEPLPVEPPAPVAEVEAAAPAPVAADRSTPIADLAWPIAGIVAAGLAAVALGAGLVYWFLS
jgi:hypothetical protein